MTVALALPLGQCVMAVHRTQLAYAPDVSSWWIEAHVPAGTPVYLGTWPLRQILPTPESADAAWELANSSELSRRKFETGLRRFGISSSQTPRALSEVNVIAERGILRGWYILGGGPQSPENRYDVHIDGGVIDLEMFETFKKTGWSFLSAKPLPVEEAGPPVMTWAGEGSDAAGVYLYASPDVRRKLKGN